METDQKFSTKINKKVLANLRKYSKTSERKISMIVSEAVAEYLDRVALRPVFLDAANEVIKEHESLLRELAK